MLLPTELNPSLPPAWRDVATRFREPSLVIIAESYPRPAQVINDI